MGLYTATTKPLSYQVGTLFTDKLSKLDQLLFICELLKSQAARQGLAVLMASAVVVLKHETSTTYQIHIYESIDLKFG